MKTIKFEGREYEVPDWVRYVAQNEDWTLWGFENNPHLQPFPSCDGYWYAKTGRVGRIKLPYWQDSLIEV